MELIWELNDKIVPGKTACPIGVGEGIKSLVEMLEFMHSRYTIGAE